MSSRLTGRLRRWVVDRFEADGPMVSAELHAYDPAVTGQDVERILAAIAIVGHDQSMAIAFELAKVDWRDLLVAARLAGDDWPDVLTEILGPP